MAEEWFDEFGEFDRFGAFLHGPAPTDPSDAASFDEPTGASAPRDPHAVRSSLAATSAAVAQLEQQSSAANLTEGDALALTHLATRLTRLAVTAPLAGGAAAVLRELPGEVEHLRRAADALGARALPALEADGTWMLDGQRSFTSWLVAATGNTRGRADREVRRARALRDYLPTFARLLAEGELGIDHVDAVVREAITTEDRLLALRDPDFGERVLAGAAEDATANEFTRTVKMWAVQMDPEAADRAWREQLAAEHVTLSATLGGYHLQGWLNPEHGQMLRIALDVQTGQVSGEDERTRGQRDAHALTGLVRQALDSGEIQRDARIRPHLIAIVPIETWTRTATATALGGRTAATAALAASRDQATGEADDQAAWDEVEEPEAILTAALDPHELLGVVPATFEDGTPLSPTQLATHMCDSAVTRVVMDARSEVIDAGREKRLFTEAQAKGILARDRHCQYPGCDANPNWCQFHHTIWWSRDGESNIAEGILLCWAHHQQVHNLGLTILRYPERWEYRTETGALRGVKQRHTHPTLPILRVRRRRQ